jgi:hypothetical protein
MTKIKVNAGNCDHSVLVTAQKSDGNELTISLDTECDMIMKMADDISSIEMRSLFTNFINNPVYKSASKHLKHTACPVPCAILKTAEVELGLCLPEDVHITFIKS